MNSDVRDAVVDALWPTDKRAEIGMYAILDAARDARIYDSVLSCGLPWYCLYSGNIPEELARVAPYLVKLEKENSLTESLIENGWGQSWGIFLGAAAPISDLRRHFHSFLTVETEDGKRMVFRYYDPRVFRTYLPTCTTDELNTVFGPVRNFLLEAADPFALLDFRRKEGRLICTEHSLLKMAAEEDLTP
jgi:hypothetical protein